MKKTILLLCFITMVIRANAIDITFDVKTYKSSTNISCHGLSDGGISSTAVNGTEPYTYAWVGPNSYSSTSQNITGLAAGSYTLTVTDAASHTASKSVTLYEPDALTLSLQPSLYIGGYNVSVMGGSDGSIISQVGGGSTPYSYLWSNASTKANISTLTAGTYSLTVTDQNSCTVSASQTMTQPTPLQITSITASNHNGHSVSCKNGQDGSITLTVSGGATPYSYTWSNGNFHQNPTGLTAGDYQVQVKDANGTIVLGSITLTQPALLSVGLTTSNYFNYNVSCSGCTDGTISTTVSGGTSAYSYAWSSGQTTANVSSLGVGSYSVTVTDANGCTTSANTNMTEPAGGGWSLHGNPADTTNAVGTVNNAPLIFKTNNTERMRIKQNGDVTINNNTTINGLLTLNNNLSLNTLYASRITHMPGDSVVHIGDSSLVFSSYNSIYANQTTYPPGPGGTTYKGIGIGTSTKGIGIASLALGSGCVASGLSGITLGSGIISSGAHSITIGQGGLWGNNTYLENTVPNSLMIGFGSSTPTLFISKADGTSGSTGNVMIGGILNTNAKLGIWNNTDANTYGMSVYSSSVSQDGHNGNGIYSAVSQPNARTFTGALFDGSNGALETINFEVFGDGHVFARDVRVTLDNPFVHPDYVFNSKYRLLSISELDRYLKENHHLPNIPTDCEVKESKGISLGEMSEKQLEKIEELTLYIIELNKRIEKLEKQIETK